MLKFNCIFSMLAGLLLTLPAAASAEMVNCGGVWTNRECDAKTAEKLENWDTRSEEVKQQAYEQSRKRTLFHELTMRTIEVRREYGIDYDIEASEQYCFQEETSLADCKTRIAETREKLDAKVAQLALVRQQEKANKLREEANKLEEERNQIEAANQVVVIEDRRNYLIVPHKRGHGHKPIRYHRTGPGSDSTFRRGGPGHRHHGSHSHAHAAGGAAISITGSGRVGNANVGIRASAGASETTSTTVSQFGSGAGAVTQSRTVQRRSR